MATGINSLEPELGKEAVEIAQLWDQLALILFFQVSWVLTYKWQISMGFVHVCTGQKDSICMQHTDKTCNFAIVSGMAVMLTMVGNMLSSFPARQICFVHEASLQQQSFFL